MDITQLREKIDNIDDQLVSLFTQRMEITRDIAAYKKENDLPIYVPARERQKLQEVAKLAGVPNPVIARAREILAQLESQGAVTPVGTVSAPAQEQMTLGDLAGGEVLDTLRNTAVDTLTPIEALNLLYQLKQKLS